MAKWIWEKPGGLSLASGNDVLELETHQFLIEAARMSGVLERSNIQDRMSVLMTTMAQEAISTSAIEGVRLPVDDVKSSILNHLNVGDYRSVANKSAVGVSALMVDVEKKIHSPLDENLLNSWQRMVITEDEAAFRGFERGRYRNGEDGPMRITSGPIGYEKVVYEALPGERVSAAMRDFIDQYNEMPKNKPLENAALAHLVFESIHPYPDGNGRVGRAISEHALYRNTNLSPVFVLSSQIAKERQTYYKLLNEASKDANKKEAWVQWFGKAALEAQKESTKMINFVLNKSVFWRQVDYLDQTNDRQEAALKKIMAFGHKGFPEGITAKKYKPLAKTSTATATRDLVHLTELGLLKKEGSGAATRYFLNFNHREKLVAKELDLSRE